MGIDRSVGQVKEVVFPEHVLKLGAESLSVPGGKKQVSIGVPEMLNSFEYNVVLTSFDGHRIVALVLHHNVPAFHLWSIESPTLPLAQSIVIQCVGSAGDSSILS